MGEWAMNGRIVGLSVLVACTAAIAACAGGPGVQAKPAAVTAVQCSSKQYKYAECAAPFRQPHLVRQISSSPCVVNRSWGFNRTTGRIWVSAGCSAVFGESGGFHYGLANTYDPNAGIWDDHGHYVGVYGNDDGPDPAITNVWIEHKTIRETAAKRDASQDPDPTVEKFDKDGNPNFDAEGNYIGCHGNGCNVDNPDAPAQAGNNPAPENGTYTSTDGDTTTTTTVQTNAEGNAGSLEQHTSTTSNPADVDNDGDVDMDDAAAAAGQ
jgi:hypothetical protein